MNTVQDAYQVALDYLYSFVDYSLQRNFRYSPEQFDLGRMFAFAERLGNPQKQYPIIHIAGTKGKGSTSALCAAALHVAGYRTALYTSPHLEDFVERIQVDGKPIAHADFVALVDELRPHIAAVPRLTTFEITTMLAFLYFARQGVQAAVIEVGLGGRLDATNICQPLVTVITSISYDHTMILGDTLALIAAEKAGIIKPGVPVVIAPQEPEAGDVLEKIAAERGAPGFVVGRDLFFEPLSHTLERQSLLVQMGQRPPVKLSLGLLGVHQVENAATAYAALEQARQAGLPLTDETIRQGFAHVAWPGRFEILRRSPPLILDCAHNRDSALRLRQALDDYFPTWPVLVVFGASEDKDIAGMFAELMPRLNGVIVVKSFHPRAADPQVILNQFSGSGLPVEVIPDVAQALHTALEQSAAANPPQIVLVTGSIFVAAGARQAWFSAKEHS